MSNLKPFNLEAAKAGVTVVTGSGLEAEIIKFDIKTDWYTVCAIVTRSDGTQTVQTFTERGELFVDENDDEGNNLFMKSTTHTGWINIYRSGITPCTRNNIYSSYEAAFISRDKDCIDTIEIEWED